jgi:hypothetical protein
MVDAGFRERLMSCMGVENRKIRREGCAMRLKLPQGNALVLAILRSRFHRLLSGLALELRYTGRRSGREYVLPVQYAREVIASSSGRNGRHGSRGRGTSVARRP